MSKGASFAHRLATILPLPFRRGEGRGEGSVVAPAFSSRRFFPLRSFVALLFIFPAIRMTPWRFLLIGKIGQVGWELRRTLAPMAQVTCVDFPEIDLTNGDSIRQWARDTRPQVIINAAAYTVVDKAESEPELAMKINGQAPGILAEEARKAGALLVHYSTDYIFDGSKTEPYVETDAPNPLGSYGRSKLAGDKAILATGGAHLIFRLCWVYGARGQNFMLT